MTSTNKKKKSKYIDTRKNRVRPIVYKAENTEVADDLVYVTGPRDTKRHGNEKFAKLSQIKALASIGCPQYEIAAIVGMDKDTFTILKRNNPSVVEAIKKGKAEGCGSLRRKQHEVAMRGDTTMLKWLGKNRLKQSDRIIAHTETSQGDTLLNMLKDAVQDDSEE